MSTGTFHYTEAERLAKQANHYNYGDGGDPVTGAALAAEAQAHFLGSIAATLAQIAGQVHNTGGKPSEWWTALHGEERT